MTVFEEDEMSAAKPKQPGLPPGAIKPFALTYACALYESMTPFAQSLARLRERTGSAPNLRLEGHRLALLQFLNDWGCRHVAKASHPLAARQLAEWYEDVEGWLPPLDMRLVALDEAYLEGLAKHFNALARRTAAKRIKGGKTGSVAFRSTATSKVLFALRPHAFPAWDRDMRDAFAYDGGGRSYVAFIRALQDKIAETERHSQVEGFRCEDLAERLSRPAYTTVGQLLIEYYWITVTRGVTPPSRSEVQRWLAWT